MKLKCRCVVCNPLLPGWCMEYGSAAVRSALWTPALWWWQLHDPLQEDYSKSTLIFKTFPLSSGCCSSIFVGIQGNSQQAVVLSLLLLFFNLFLDVFFIIRGVHMITQSGSLQVVSSSSTKCYRSVSLLALVFVYLSPSQPVICIICLLFSRKLDSFSLKLRSKSSFLVELQ